MGAAWAGLIVAAALYGGGAALGLSGQMAGPADYLLDDAAFFVPFFGFSVIGAVIAIRRPDNPIGWILAAIGSLSLLSYFGGSYALYEEGSLPGADVLAWLATWIWIPAAGFIIVLLLLFPDGRLPSPRWRWLVWLTVAWFILLLPGVLAIWPLRGMTLLEQGSGDVSAIPEARFLNLVANIGAPALLLGALASLVIRFRQTRGVQRQQLKWVAFASALLVVVVPVSIVLPFDETVWGFLLVLALLAIPISIAIAIFRYRLYDIDLVINRTLVYGSLTVLLGAVYVAGVVGLPRLLPLAEDNDLVVAGSTLAVAALFSPLRRRLQSFVDRRFYRSRYDAARTVEAFAARLREEVDLEELTSDLVALVGKTLQPAHVSVWLAGSPPLPRPGAGAGS